MAQTSTYLNFNGTTEAAFTFYKSVFGTEFAGPIARMGDAPPQEGQPPLSDRPAQRRSTRRSTGRVSIPTTPGSARRALTTSYSCADVAYRTRTW